MKNIDGALGFEATLDIDDFNVSAQAMERHIQQISTNVQAESADMEQSLMEFAQKGAMYIQTYLVGQGMMNLLNSIVQVRGQFQQLEIAFGTMLGSEEKANALMQQMINTAAHTPFDLQGVAEGAKQLLAYGESADKVNDTLVRLGNIASGLSIPLNDIVYLYGTTMVQGRLYAQDVRQFTGRGIPLVKELAQMYGVTAEEINNMVSAGKIGFPDVEKVLNKLTDAGGQFYNLMEKQSASLTGMISNLEDAWDSMLNDKGKQNQDAFAGAIESATYLVEHYQTIINVLKAVAVGYGTVKAAIVLNTLATKGYTGVAFLDNTARQAKVGLMKLEATLSGEVAAQTQAMTAAKTAHVTALQAELTAEELSNLQKKLKIATIAQLLTAQQQEYLSNLGLTTSSEGYEAAAMGVLSVEQRLALEKTDLSSKSAVYIGALEAEVAAKRSSAAASLETMRADVKAAYAKMEAAKQTAVSAMQATEAARYEVYWAKQSGDATRIATAEKKLEGATENQAIARKAALAANTDFYTKKKALEATATRTSTAASAADTAAKGAQAAATGVLSTVTHTLTNAFRTLWATLAANPFGAILSVVGLVISAFTLFRDEEEETKTVMGEFQETTQKEIEKLDTLMAVMRTTAANTKTHKDSVSKVNEMCKEYNTTLIEENDTLDQQEQKYKDLQKAIQATTADKIKAKYAEQALQQATDDNTKSLENLMKMAAVAQTVLQEAYEVDAGNGNVLAVPAITEASENIRNASDAVWEAVESMATEKAQELSKLTGDAYTQAFDQSLNEIVTTVQAATGATNSEMENFKGNLSRYLTEITDHTRTANTELDKIDRQLAAFFSTKPDPSPITDSTDYVSMSFEDLEQKIKENEAEIDQLNKQKVDPKVNTGGVDLIIQKLQEALALQKELNGAMEQKLDNLNTENGINARIKQLKDERAEVDINSQKYKDLTAQINKLQDKLPNNTRSSRSGGGRSGSGRGGSSGGSSGGGNSAEQAVNNAEALRQKQLEADRKLEEARIEIMTEGYAKRKALLDLQHKRNLDAIDREEQELIKARKKAGKGGLSQAEKDGFAERRNLENQDYTLEGNKLFDAEIQYRKKEYAAYWQWVRNVGKDVADEHFKDLIAEGTGFSSWVEKQITALEQKRATQPELFSDGDATALNSLKQQQNEILGNKSAMDLFRDSVQQSISQAQTLAEKLQAVADLKEKLSKGEFHLNQDETAAASYSLENEDAKLQEEVNKRLLNDFRTYEEKRKAIQDEWALLREAAQKAGDQNRIKMINEAEAEALSTLNANMLKQSDSWKALFEDLDVLGSQELAQMISDFQKQLHNADLKLNPVDYKALMDSLDRAKEQLITKNPFKAINQFYDDYIEAKKRLAEAKAKVAAGKGDNKDVKEAEKDMKRASQGVTKSISEITNAAAECGASIQGVFESLGMDEVAEGIGTATELMGQLGGAAESVGKLMSGDILGGVTGMVGAVSGIIGLFNKLHDKKYEKRIKALQEEIDALERSYSRLERAYNNTYWVFNDEEKAAFQGNIDLINQQIEALERQKLVARQSWDFVKYAQLTKGIQELQKQLDKAKESADMFGLYEAQKANLRKQQEDIREQIENEKKKKDTDDSKISQWNDKIEEINQQIEDLDRQMMVTLAGTDVKTAIDEFADALVEAYCKGEDAAEALGEKTKQVLKKAVVEALKRQFLAKGINDAVEYLGTAMQDSVLSDAERATFTAMVNKAGDLFNTALGSVGDWIKDLEDEAAADPLTGAVQNLSEETGGIIAGRINAAIINQAEQTAQLKLMAAYLKAILDGGGITVGSYTGSGSDLMGSGWSKLFEYQVDQTGIMRQQLEYQAMIAANTAQTVTEIRDLHNTMRRIEQGSGNSLLSQGIS